MSNYIQGLVIVTLVSLAVTRTLRRRVCNPSPTAAVPSQQAMHNLAHDLAAKIERVQVDFSHLEHHLALEHIQQEEMEVARMIDSMYTSFVHKKPTLPVCTRPSFGRSRRRRRLSSLCDGYTTSVLDTSRMSSPFTTFCERLLAMNRIWKQEKQLKRLQSDIQSAEASKQTNAFNAFCSQLLLQNKVWRLEKQVVDLEVEGEKLKKRFEATVKRAAKKMMEELRHHRLVEEYVESMNAELDSCKHALESQHALHDRELQEFTWEWCQDYSKLAREVEKLKLAQQAKCVEQDLQTEYEDSLYEDLKTAQRRVEELEMRLEGYQPTLVDASVDDYDDGVTEDDRASISSFTCVSTSYDGRDTSLSMHKRPPPVHRKARPAMWIRSSKRRSTPRPKRLIIGNHTGFSFNPLFYGSNVSPLVLRARRPLDKLSGKDNVALKAQSVPRKRNTSKATAVRWRI